MMVALVGEPTSTSARCPAVAVSTNTLIAWAVLAFGGVYEWAYRPAFVAAAAIGIVDLSTSRLCPDLRRLFIGLAAVVGAIAVQIVPIPRSVLSTVSPKLNPLLQHFSLAYAANAARWHPLSLQPDLTLTSLLALVSLTTLLAGLCAALTTQAAASVATFLSVLGVLVTLFGIVQKATFNGRLYWFWVTEGTPWSSFGPFVNHNHCAGFLVMAAALALGQLRVQAHVANRYRLSSRFSARWLLSENVSRLVLAAFSVAVIALGVVWTQSRSGLLALLMVFGTFSWMVRGHTRTRAAWFALATFVVLAAVSWRGVDTVVGSFADPRTPTSRLLAWRDTVSVARDFPAAGTGLNTFGASMLFYQRANLETHLAEAHSDYLQLAAEGGVLVGLPVCAVLLIVARTISQRRQQDRSTGDWKTASLRDGAIAGLFGIAVQEIAEFSLQMPGNALVFTVLLAIALFPPNRTARAAAH